MNRHLRLPIVLGLAAAAAAVYLVGLADSRRSPAQAAADGCADLSPRSTKLDPEIPPAFPPVGNYVNAVRTGTLLVLGGQVPVGPNLTVTTGRLGEDLDVAAGRKAARQAALTALSAMRTELGSLDRIVRIVSVRGFVNSTPAFTGHTQVIDAASDVFTQVFGERGRHARIAFGVSSLPANLSLELEVLAEVCGGP